jgi:hypothetical protein
MKTNYLSLKTRKHPPYLLKSGMEAVPTSLYRITGGISAAFLMLTFLFLGHGVKAQAVSTYTFSTGTGATLNAMTGATTLVGSSNDDGVSAVTTIPFSFTFAGTAYTQFSANSNGLVRLGSVAVTNQWENTAANVGVSSPAIMPYWDDLATGTNGSVRYVVTGTSPNRILAIEWLVTIPRNITGTAAARFQCWLYEGTNQVRFIYGAGMVANVADYTVGLATSSTAFNTVNTSTQVAPTTGFRTANTTAITSGRFYSFVPPAAPAACSGTPAPGNTVSGVSSACPGVSFNLSLQNATSGTGVSYLWQSADDLAFTSNVATVTGTTASVSTSQSSAKYYRATVTCGASSGTSTPVLVSMSAFTSCYCAASATNTSTSFEKISNVTFNTINNNSTGTAGYQSFTNISTSVSQASSYSLSVALTNPWEADQILVWIDYNQDGDFADAGEQVYSSVVGGPYSSTIIIPSTATLGATRMRVRLHDTGDGPNATACGSSTYGQVEDYTINVTAGAPCSEPPSAATASISGMSTCVGQPISMTASNIASGLGNSFGWQSSTDQQSWQFVAGGSNLTYSTSATAGSTYYRFATTCGSTSSYSNVVSYTGTACGSVLVPATGSNTVACGTNTFLYDSGGPTGNYGNTQNGYTVLQNSGTNIITINGSLDSETDFDFLNIYSGTGTSGTLLQSYSGTGALPTFTFPAGQTVTVQFTSDSVAAQGGFNLAVSYSGTCAPPAITNFSPSVMCASGTVAERTVTITGSVFTGATAVTFNGTPAASFTVTNDSTISAVVPATAGTGAVSITGPGGTGTSSGTLTIKQNYTFYADADNDTYGAGNGVSFCAVNANTPPAGYSVNSTDCDDANAQAHPGGSEVYYNGFDDNCSGSIDEGNQITTQNYTAYCNTTQTNIYQGIAVNYMIPNITAYRFRVTNLTNPAEPVQYLERGYSSFKLTDLPQYHYGTTYAISTMLQRNGIWLGYYGAECNVTTPAIPQLQNCGGTIAARGTMIFSQVKLYITGYQFEVTRLTTGQVLVVNNGAHYFRFTDIPFYAPGEAFSVRVSVKTTSYWSAFGAACIINTPGQQQGNPAKASTKTIDELAVVAHPNPYAESFMIKVTSNAIAPVGVKAYDMLGRLIEDKEISSENISSFQFGINYPSGVYNIIVTHGDNVKTLRVIKR